MTKTDYKKELLCGNIGWLEYHLHKDKSWIAVPFQTMDECNTLIKKLKIDGYNPTPIFFESKIFKIDNPNLTAKEYLQKLIDIISKYQK